MRLLLLSLICFISCASFVSAQTDIKLEIGAKLPRKYVPRKIKEQIATSPNQFRPFIRKTIDNINYIIAFDEKTHEIKFLQTYDEDFCTANGLCMGSEIAVTREQLIIYPSWYIYAPATPDGWHPVVGTDLEFFVDPAIALSNLKEGETRTVKIFAFSKGR